MGLTNKTKMLKESKKYSESQEKRIGKSSGKKVNKAFKIRRKKQKIKIRNKENEKMSIHSANSGKKKNMRRQKESMTCSNFFKTKNKKGARKFIVR